jgi:hypothetical protein
VNHLFGSGIAPDAPAGIEASQAHPPVSRPPTDVDGATHFDRGATAEDKSPPAAMAAMANVLRRTSRAGAKDSLSHVAGPPGPGGTVSSALIAKRFVDSTCRMCVPGLLEGASWYFALGIQSK